MDPEEAHRITDRRAILRRLLGALPEKPETPALGSHHLESEAWNGLVDQATQDGVLRLVSPALKASGLPAAAEAALEQRLAVAAMWHRHVASTLAHVLTILEAARVRAVALKGPVLAERLYGDPLLRPCIDVDLLVSPADLDAAARALTAAGFAGDTELAASYLREHAHHLHFSRTGAPPVELHFRAYAGFGVVIPASALFERAAPYQFEGAGAVLVPSPEDEFIYLAVHAAGHSFVRLLWLFDLKMLLRKHPDIDWDAVATRSASLGVSAAVGYAIRLLREWLRVETAPLPPALSRRGARSHVADRLLAEASTPRERSLRDNIGGLVFTAMLCDRLSASAWMLEHHIGRAMRHRLQRLAPGYLPQRWTG